MAMAGRIRMNMARRLMPIDAKLLTLTQWLSPSYPVGAFAWSHGVERAIRDNWIDDAAALEDWLRACLTEGSGRADAIWLPRTIKRCRPRPSLPIAKPSSRGWMRKTPSICAAT